MRLADIDRKYKTKPGWLDLAENLQAPVVGKQL
jgi:hypothetical protein